MPVLIYETGPLKGHTLRLEMDKVYSLGRDPKNDVEIDDELASRVHARIRGKDGTYFIKDSGSSNGTLVNDQKFDLTELASGDKITIGATILSFLSDDEAGGGAGKTLGGYKLLQRLGRGGMGTVYRALQLSLNREVALKILSPELSRDPAFLQRFLKEARAAGQLNHPNIVQVYDVDQAEGLIFYAMEFVPGGTVEDHVFKSGLLPIDDALRLLLDAARGLQYAEVKKIVHRDIKPDNLMMTDIGTVKIADLGLALAAHDDTGESTGILGTPHFISPEQARGQALDTRSDLYSLGATFFRMLTGKTMYHGANAKDIIRQQVKEPPPSLKEARNDAPDRICDIFQRLVQKDPADRFQSPSELIDAIEAVRARRSGRTGVVVFGLVAIAAIAASVLVVLKNGENANDGTRTVIVNTPDEELTHQMKEQQALLLRQQRENEAMQERLALDGREESLGREAYLAGLKDLIARHDGTTAAEGAREKAEAIEAAIANERRAAAQRAAAIEAAIAKMEKTVATAISENRFVDALIAIDTRAGTAEALATDTGLSDAARRLALDVERTADQVLNGLVADAKRALAASEFKTARSLLDQVAAAIDPRDRAPEGSARERLHAVATLVEAARAEADRVEDEHRRSVLAADLEILRSTFDWNRFYDDLAAYRIPDALQRLEAMAKQLKTEEYIDYVERRIDDVRAADWMLTELKDRLRTATLANTEIEHPERHAPATITGLSPENDGVLVQVARAGGLTTSVLRFDSFDTTAEILDLFERVATTANERLHVARSAVALASAAAHAHAVRIREQIDRYDPAAGWSAAQRAGLVDVTFHSLDSPRLTELLTSIESEATLKAEIDALRRRIDREREVRDIFIEALEPFSRPESSIRFSASLTRLEQIVATYRDTDFFLATYDLFNGGGEALSLVD